MAFSRAVKTRALVLAARHCCLCHRYKGVKVEVHHIVPRSKGGEDTFDNAIALCFDCHADAGHYNADHPRGTKISPEELSNARDTWHKIVEEHEIQPIEVDDRLYCRFLVCKSFSALSEIVVGDLSHIPVDKPHLAKNPAGEFLSQLVRQYSEHGRHAFVWGPTYKDRDEFRRQHPEAVLDERSDAPYYPYFEARRVPKMDEFENTVSKLDPISAMLLAECVARDEISAALAYEEVCGDDYCYREIYRTRPLWGAFLAATNICNHPVSILSATCKSEQTEGVNYRGFADTQTSELISIGLPRVKLMPNETVLMPVATILGPLGDDEFGSTRSEFKDISTGEVQTLVHAKGAELASHISAVGPSFSPVYLTIEDHGLEHSQEVHEFDLGNLYVVDRFWECGSCPHLFVEMADGSLTYMGALWAREALQVQTQALTMPIDAVAIVLAELEQETTQIIRIGSGSRALAENVSIQHGETFRAKVEPGERLEFVGYYAPSCGNTTAENDPWRKNVVVGEFMRTQHSSGDELW